MTHPHGSNPDDFSDLFALRSAEPGHFVALPPGDGFLFGGLTMALALRAASATVKEGMAPKSLHTLFLNAGQWGPALDLEVSPLADSRAFSSRHVSVDQAGKHIVAASASFHVPEGGEDWQVKPPDVSPPEELAPRSLIFGSGADPGEIRPVLVSAPGFDEVIHPYWGRAYQPAPTDDPAIRWCTMLFLTDYMVVSTPFPRGSGAGAGQMSRTLEHTIWFHRPILDDDWLLYSCDATTVVGGRFFSQGTVHDRIGRLLATFAQQGMIRPLPAGRS